MSHFICSGQVRTDSCARRKRHSRGQWRTLCRVVVVGTDSGVPRYTHDLYGPPFRPPYPPWPDQGFFEFTGHSSLPDLSSFSVATKVLLILVSVPSLRSSVTRFYVPDRSSTGSSRSFRSEIPLLFDSFRTSSLSFVTQPSIALPRPLSVSSA